MLFHLLLTTYYLLLLRFFDFQNLPPFVHSGFEVETMRLHRFAGGGVNEKLRRFECVVRAALARSRF